MSKMVHIAPCRFCGQTIQFESAPLTEEQEIEEATMRCDCIDAELYQMRKKQEKTALGNISALFGENAGEQNAQGEIILSILNAAIGEMLDGRLEKIALNLAGGIKAIISKSSKGEIKVERVETKKRQLTG